MDFNDASPNSVGDEKYNEASSMDCESVNECSDSPISNMETTQSNGLKFHEIKETGQSADAIKKSSNGIKNKRLKIEESETSFCPIGKDSSSNVSLKEVGKNLKTSDAMLSFTNTEATCSSFLPQTITTEEKSLKDFQDSIEMCESKNVSYLENPVLRLPHAAVGNPSNSSSTSYFSQTNKEKECLPTDCAISGAEGSSFKEECNELKTSDMSSGLTAATILDGLLKTRLYDLHKSVELQSLKEYLNPFEWDETSDNEKLSTNEDKITQPPTLLKNYETFLMSENGKAGDLNNSDSSRQNYCHKDKIRTERHISSNAAFLPTKWKFVPNASRKVGNSPLQACKTLEQTSPEEDDWNIYETFDMKVNKFKSYGDGKSPKQIEKSSNSWIEEIVSFCKKAKNTDSIPRMDTEKLLEEVRYFFQNNKVDADENLSREEMEYRIVTSNYFSDEFCRCHGLFPSGDLTEEFEIKNSIERSVQFITVAVKLKRLRETLAECDIYEEHFKLYFTRRLRDGEYKMQPTIESSNREQYYNLHLKRIEKEVGFHLMQELFKELNGGQTFQSFLWIPDDPIAHLERCESTKYTNSLQLSRSLSPNELGNFDFPSTSKGDYHQESTQMDWKESSESVSTSDSSALDASVLTENEICNRQLSLSPGKREIIESRNEQSHSEDGSQISAKNNLDSQK